MDRVHQILNVAKSLSEQELMRVSESLLKMLRQTNGVQDVSVKRAEKCRKCDSEQIVKFGVDKNGKQRYKCKYSVRYLLSCYRCYPAVLW